MTATMQAPATVERRIMNQPYELGDKYGAFSRYQQWQKGDEITIEPNPRGGFKVGGFWDMSDVTKLRAMSIPVE